MRLNIKKFLITFIVTCLILIVSLGFTIIIYNNLVNIAKIFTDNKYIIVFFEKLEALSLGLPIIFIVFMFLFDFVILYLLFYKKNLFIIFIIILTLITLCVIFFLTRIGDYFVFQVIDNMRNANV